MKTKDIIGAGLCTILLGSSSIAQAQKVEGRLEIVIEKNVFTGPYRNYTLKRDPMTFGFESQSHEIQKSGDYQDTYFGKDYSGMLAIICSKQNTDLIKAYNATYASFIKGTANSLSSISKKSEKRLVEGKITELDFTLVDNYPAIRSSANIMLIDSTGKYINLDKPRHILLLTVVRTENNIYGIMMYYNQFTDKDKANADGAFNEVVNSFRVLKK